MCCKFFTLSNYGNYQLRRTLQELRFVLIFVFTADSEEDITTFHFLEFKLRSGAFYIMLILAILEYKKNKMKSKLDDHLALSPIVDKHLFFMCSTNCETNRKW